MVKVIARQLAAFMVAASLVLFPLHVTFAAAYITPDSFSGHPTTLHISGGGWNSGEIVSLYLGSISGSPVATATVGSDSFFGPTNVTIPANTPQGALSIIGIGSISGEHQTNSYYVVPFAPSINQTNSMNVPGGVATFSGTGFAPGETVNFSINGTISGHGSADSTGAITNVGFTIPFLASGTQVLHATGASSGADAIDYFYIGGFYPSTFPSTYYVLPSQTLSFNGSGFAPNETIRIFEGTSTSPISTFTTDATGSFNSAGGFVLPFSFVNSSRNFHLVGMTSHVSADTSVTVGQFFPSVYPSAYYVAPSQPLSFSGAGFAANETVRVFAGASTVPLSNFTTNASGEFTDAGTFIMPYSFAGSSQLFRLVGTQSGAEASVTVTIGQYYPQLSLSGYFVNPGQTLTVMGSGFAPNENVSIRLGSAAPVVITADAFGSIISSPLTVPFTTLTMLTITATGQNSHAQSSVDVTLGTYYPSIAPSTYYAYPGDNITFNGTGFAPNELVTLSSGSSTIISTTSSASGTMSGLIATIPFGSTGSKIFTATGGSSHATASVTVTVGSLYAYADADNYYVTPGSTVHVRGTGFAPGENVTITIGSSTVHAVASGPGGSTPYTAITIPFGLISPAMVTMTGDTSGATASVGITLAPFYPSVTPDTWYTNPGVTVHYSGSGFAAGERVNGTINGLSIGSATATASGIFANFGVLIPANATVAHVVFTGANSHASAVSDVGLAPFSPQINPSTWYTTAGSNVTFTGTGFAAGETVAIALNGSAVGNATVSNDGSFSSSPIQIPFSASMANFGFSSSVSGTHIPLTVTVAPLNPSIWLSSYYDNAGKPLTVNGAGFAGGETVNVTFAGTSLGSIAADASGNFALATTVPYGPAGDKTIQAHGVSSSVNANASFTLPQVYVSLQLGSYAGAPGDAVTFIGSGYLPNETVTVTTDRTGSVAQHTFTADASGNFTNSAWHIPATFTGGPLMITVTGNHSFAPKSITYYVTGA